MFHVRSLKTLSLTAVLAGTMMIGGTAATLAQDTEPAPDVLHPAHVHAGTCEDLNPNPIHPLTDITPRLNEGDDEEANEPQGALTAPRVLYSETDVEMSLEDMLAESHAINVHESQENIQTYIACGELGGVVVDDDGDKLTVGLRSVNDSGYTGIAILEADGDNTNIKVYLAEPAVEQDPAATPVS